MRIEPVEFKALRRLISTHQEVVIRNEDTLEDVYIGLMGQFTHDCDDYMVEYISSTHKNQIFIGIWG